MIEWRIDAIIIKTACDGMTFLKAVEGWAFWRSLCHTRSYCGVLLSTNPLLEWYIETRPKREPQHERSSTSRTSFNVIRHTHTHSHL
jgi:hypothetical protein